MIFFVKMSIIASCMLQLFNVNDFLKMLIVFKSKLFELTKRCLRRETLNFLDNFDNITFVDNEELNSKLKILEYKQMFR